MTAQEQVMDWPWSRPMRAYLKDGTTREGTLKFRGKRGFCLSDSINTISWAEVEDVESGGQA